MIYVEAHKEDAELNELTRGEITYSYDQFSSLVSAKGRDILTVFRTFDEVGNIYGTKDKSDRSYKEGSRLEASGIDLKEKRNVFQGGYGRLVTKGVEYSYDEEGNLVKKREKDGKTWEYMYYGNGMLRKVVRPDKSEVSFGYDAFGRRIEKCITGTGSEKAIRFLWDGNALLHQWEEEADKADKRRKPLQRIEDQAEYVAKLSEKRKQEEKEKAARGEAAPESLVTWIFQDDFVPRARITKEGYSSIITDYLGTPTEAYDGEGSLVWKRELDINGKVMPPGKDRYGHRMKEAGETGFVPFRFQGQYEDEETGLYYNRFRYYDPETGQYTQQDPIGLAGGNPTLYGYVYNPLIEIDPWGLINFKNFSNDELIQKIWELAYRDKRIAGNGGTHGVVHRIREQINGAMRPPNPGWYTHDEQIKAGLKNLRDGLNEARTRGLANTVNDMYPKINKVSTMSPPKPTDVEVPKLCR